MTLADRGNGVATQDGAPGRRSAAGQMHDRPPNVLLIVLDCARAKNFSLSGGGRIARTPVIDSLADRGTTFPRAVAPSNWTLPSHVSIFTGKYPNEHGVRSYQKPVDFPETTAEFLKKAGWDTCMLSENPQLFGDFGLEKGFDFIPTLQGGNKVLADIFGVKRERRSIVYSPGVLQLLSRLPPLIAPISWGNRLQEVKFKRAVCTEYMADRFDEWLTARRRERPFYAFFNFVDTHEPYRLVPEAAPLSLLDRTYLYTPRSHLFMVPGLQSRIRWDAAVGGYLESIEDADRKVGRLLGILERLGEVDRTMVIVTADHGQAFGEMGNVLHGAGATDSVTRVPLVLAAPKGVSIPHRVERWVSLCEIDSWIRAVATGQAPYDSEGRSPNLPSSSVVNEQVVYSEGPPVSDANRSMKGVGQDRFWNHRLLAAYRGNEKFVLDTDTGEVLSWDMAQDPDTYPPNPLTREVAQSIRREIFGPYEATEAARAARAASLPPPIDVEIDQRLQSWGYV